MVYDDFTKSLLEFTAENEGRLSLNWYRAVIEWIVRKK